MKKQLLMFTVLSFFAIQLFSQVTVTGGSTATYSNVNAAFAAINAGTHTGAITIDITASTTEPLTPTPLAASGQGAANYTSIIIRPTVVASISGAPSSGRGVLEFDGADNITIDGDIIGGPVNRDLTIENTNAPNITATAAIRLIGRATLGLGATNYTITNCKIAGSTPGNDGLSGSTVTTSYGLYAGTNAANLTSSGTGNDYDNITVSNCEFTRAYFGLYIGGLTTATADNLNINNNIFGSAITSEKLSYRGIELNNATNSIISQNEILELKATSSISNAGISTLGGSSNLITISRNKIYGIWSTSTGGWGAYGVNLAGGNNHVVINNVIYDIITTNYNSTSTTFQAFGIRLASGTGHKIFYNSVNLFGALAGGSTTNCYSAAFVVTSTAITGIEVKNNIFNNIQTSTVTTPLFMAMWFPASYNFLNASINNNAYTVSNDAAHFVGRVGTVNYSTVSNWAAISQVNNPTNDNASVPPVNAGAPFISNTNLNFANNTVTPIESGAVTTTVTGIDHDAFTRPKTGVNANTNPDMGAYEFDGLAGVATDAGVAFLVSPATNGCYGAAENLVVSVKNYGTASISNIPVTVIVSGAATQTSNATYPGPLAAGASANFTVATLNMLTAGTYSFNAYTSLAGDLNAPNDAMGTATRTVFPISTIPTQVDFTGFTGANLTTNFPLWSEATSSIVPTGTTSLWTSQTGLNGAGNITARINLLTNTRNEWLVGPKFTATSTSQITFDAAVTAVGSVVTPSVMGSDDMVRVMVSTDCGISFTPVFTVSATNSLTTSFTNFVAPLGAYAGQNIIVAFLATDGPIDNLETYDFHLDNINLYNALPQDAGVSTLTKPALTGCYGAAENMVVTLNNYGSLPVTNIPVTVLVSGATSQTTNATFTGTIAPASSASFTVGTVNMTTAGIYNFTAYTALSGDGNLTNDTMAIVTRTVVGPSALPTSVSFTGFTGANLTANFPLWSEATGSATPTGSTSAWTSQNNLNGAGNVTARINLLAVSRNEWIVGPKFTATANSQISFDAAITAVGSVNTYSAMGSDDKVRVMVSTDCGLSYAPVFTVSATNSLTTLFTNFVVNLGAYAGQDIIVAFLAQDGPTDDLESYDFHLDNINLYNGSATDAGVTAIVTPSLGACYSANETMVVTVRNFGTASISNVPVSVYVGGALSQTITNTYPGPLASGASANFTVGTINMSVSGIYTITSTTGLAGDVNTFNDISTINRTVSPSLSIIGKNSLCLGDSTVLTAGGSAISYTWSTGANTNTIAVNPTSTTVYTLTASDGTCTAVKISTVTVTNPTISATGVAACSGTTVSLTASAFGPVNWYATPSATTPIASGNTYTTTAVANSTVYAEAKSTGTGSLQTLFSGGNSCGGGTMFDLTPTNGSIQIDSIDVNTTTAASSTFQLMLFYKVGTYLGNETSAAAWTAWDTVTAVSAGSGNASRVVFNPPLVIPASQLTGIFFNYPSSYTNGTNLYSNTDISVQTGAGLCSQFGGVNAGRMFNGNIYYTKVGCTSPRIPVTVTVNPAPTLSVTTTNSVLCAGSSATLIAYGATTYSWSTGQTTQGIIVSPTVTTSYTLTGTAGGCSKDTTITQVVGTCTGIDQLLVDNSGVIVYPNPSTGIYNVIVNQENTNATLVILDALGRVVLTDKLNSLSNTVNAEKLANGVYMYRIVNGNQTIKQGKLVKE
ncbi:MAG: T9SS type A sorting domain-containing protein [Bacteroidetes bacterium]|nr:T9SS type A sorting domain-containing protein [Bacteroidota bacterium]